MTPPLTTYGVYDGSEEPRRFLAPALDAVMRMQAEKVEAELRAIGESLWTAPDTVRILNYGGYSAVVNPL